MPRTFAQQRRMCLNRPKGAGNLPPGDPRRSHLPRRCRQTAATGREGNKGRAPKFELGGGGRTLRQVGKAPGTGIVVEAPKSHKTAGWR